MVKQINKLEVTTIATAHRLVALLCLCFCFVTTQAGPFIPSDLSLKKTQVTLQKMFGNEIELKVFENNSNLFAILQNDSVIAYYCIENAPSKHDEFEFLVVYDVALNIQKVQVLVYREDYGFEIKSKRWLQQFTSRKTDSVQAISGATISVNSLKYAIDRLNHKIKSTVHL